MAVEKGFSPVAVAGCPTYERADVEKAMQAGYSTAAENVRNLGFGAGMGLPNMKKYTDSMEIETEVGVGTTITMKVSCKDA